MMFSSEYIDNDFHVGSDLSEETEEICQVKNSIAQLYTTLNIEQHQLDRQRHLQETLDQLREDILPFEEVSA